MGWGLGRQEGFISRRGLGVSGIFSVVSVCHEFSSPKESLSPISLLRH